MGNTKSKPNCSEHPKLSNNLEAAKPRESDNLAGLVANFMPYIRKRANRIKSLGLDADDIVQEGLIGLLGAVSAYSPDAGASFETFAITCIDNSINSALRAAARKKNAPLNSSVSLDADAEPGSLLPRQPSAEDIAILREEYADVVRRINDELSAFERDVLALYLEGYSYGAMAEQLGTTPKAVDNALWRARQKLKKK